MRKHIQHNCRLALTLDKRLTYSRTVQADLAPYTERMPTGLYAIKRGKRPYVLAVLNRLAADKPDHFTTRSLDVLGEHVQC